MNCITAFSVGYIIYPLIEISFRGFTHWSMAIAGGICVLSIHLINIRCVLKSYFIKCLIGSVIITLIEFIVGCIVNIYLKLNVWDYSHHSFNLLGQICPLFSAFWFVLCIPIFSISNFIKNQLINIKIKQEKLKELSVK